MPPACSQDKAAVSWPAHLDFRLRTHEKQILNLRQAASPASPERDDDHFPLFILTPRTTTIRRVLCRFQTHRPQILFSAAANFAGLRQTCNQCVPHAPDLLCGRVRMLDARKPEKNTRGSCAFGNFVLARALTGGGPRTSKRPETHLITQFIFPCVVLCGASS